VIPAARRHGPLPVAEHGVTPQVGHGERRPRPFDQHGQQVGEHLVGVLQLRALQVHGVAGDVGDKENPLRGLHQRWRNHRRTDSLWIMGSSSPKSS
jgi:hypothetical protein